MTARFNPPPGWPPAPAGWTPPPGWSPDPSWPAPPAGWQLWVDDAQGSDGDVSRFSKPDPTEQDASAAQTAVLPSYQAPGAPLPGQVPLSGPVPTAPAAPWASQPAQAGAPTWQQGPGGPVGPDGAPARTASKQWLIPVVIAVVAVVAIVVVLFVTGVFGDDDTTERGASPSSASSSADPTGKASDDPSEEATTTEGADEPTAPPTDKKPAPAPGSSGSRTSPLAPGEIAPLGVWTSSFAATNTDAWAEISAAGNSVSDFYAPAEGDRYLMAPVTITYLGESSEPLYMLDYVFVSADGVTYKDKCSYVPLPNGLDTGQELYTDASVTGNVCITVPADKIDGGVWRMSAWDRVNKDTEAYFGLS